VEEIFRVKGRPEERALPILGEFAGPSDAAGEGSAAEFFAAAEEFWPGALTLGGGCFAPVAAEK